MSQSCMALSYHAAMTTWIGLLRGVNVGGKNKLPMADLRRIVTELGHTEVRTYIQSGNVLFDAKEKDATKLAIALRKAIEEETSIDCAVVLRTSKELAATVAKNPFPDDCEHVHVVFMESPSEVAFDGAKYAPEEIAIVGRDVYLHLPNGVGRSKLAADVARKKQLSGTARNWRTIETLLEMAG